MMIYVMGAVYNHQTNYGDIYIYNDTVQLDIT